MKNITIIALPKVPRNDPLYGVVQTVLSLVEKVETLGGLKSAARDERVLTVGELKKLGLVAENHAGELYNPSAVEPALDVTNT